MNTPNLLKGHLYPSTRMARCHRFHPCLVTKKCQSFDQHCLQCCFCENRVPAYQLGGFLPEGELMPDMQHAVVMVQQRLGVALTHPDDEGQRINPHADAVDYKKWVKATDMMREFLLDKQSLEQKVTGQIQQGKEELLGRL